MGRKLDALFRRNSKTWKFRAMADLAISRISILRKHHQVRCSYAQSDVVQLLNLGHQERALLRVEQVIKEQNMLDAFVMMENYFHLLIERALEMENKRECPDELKEATSSLIFASSRLGEFPELQQIREILTSMFGKAFTTCAVEVRNECGVHPNIARKLSTRKSGSETREKVLKQIALENGIKLNLQHDNSVIKQGKQEDNQNRKQLHKQDQDAILSEPLVKEIGTTLPEEITSNRSMTESIRSSKKYEEVVAAVQEALESAVTLSRSGDEDHDDHPGFKQEQVADSNKSTDTESASLDMTENSKVSCSKTLEQEDETGALEQLSSASSSESEIDNSRNAENSSNHNDQSGPLVNKTLSGGSNTKTEKKQDMGSMTNTILTN